MSSIFSKMSSFIEKSVLDAILSIFKQFDFSQNSLYLGLDPLLLQRDSEWTSLRTSASPQPLQSLACMHPQRVTAFKAYSNYTAIRVSIYTAVSQKHFFVAMAFFSEM